jgi:hypothetical protein
MDANLILSRPRRLQNRTVRDFCAVSRPPSPPLVTTSPWTAVGAALPAPVSPCWRHRRRRGELVLPFLSLPLSSSLFARRDRGSTEPAWTPSSLLLWPLAARPAASTSSAVAAASRSAGEPRPCASQPRRCALAACPACPHASGHRFTASTAEPSPNQRAAARPAPRARSTVAAVASYGDRTAEPDPAGVPAARPVRSSTIAVPWTHRQPCRTRQIAHAQRLAVIAQLVRALAFACAQCVDGTPSTPRLPPPSTPRLPPIVPVPVPVAPQEEEEH